MQKPNRTMLSVARFPHMRPNLTDAPLFLLYRRLWNANNSSA